MLKLATSTTKIKLYGPGISQAFNVLSKLHTHNLFNSKIFTAGNYIGETADYEIVWKDPPPPEDTYSLVKFLDKAFANIKCRYTVSSSSPDMRDILEELEESKSHDIAITFVRLIGPSISQALDTLNENIKDIPGVKTITGELIGRFDYSFEWLRIPETEDIVQLTQKMDQILEKTGVIYSIATRSKLGTFKAHTTERELSVDPIRLVLHRKL